MAQANLDNNGDVLYLLKDHENSLVFAILSVGVGTAAFTVVAINSANTTRYFWVDDAADLVYSTTLPTAVDSSAAKIGDQS